MEHVPQSETVGAIERTFDVATGRRLRQGIGFTLAGAVVTWIGVTISAAYIADAGQGGFSPLPGLVLGIGLVLLMFGVVRLAQSALRPAERFDIGERGLVHHTARADRVVPWTQITGVRELGVTRTGDLAVWLGVALRAVIVVRGARNIRFNSLAGDANLLLWTIQQHTTPAGRP
ncbi:hypothetical protein OHA72_51605 [Dactylosporangium sp. NBC_01737]|uniref:hypothetical protein n=1 Tax=Dactylosporangium sp. NBC_01737 TaxID=2975959 RepID=UPI002E105F29|nr:hypothetical protein OHA72_51605 [Dactylosporangium sp. NBC_01737]